MRKLACAKLHATYNARMTSGMPSFCRPALLLLATLAVSTLSFAQPATPALPAAPAGARPDQAIERIRTEDAGSRIDELRVGGETQSITVQPKTGGNAPAYEVKPPDSARGNAPSRSSGDTNGSRVWNVLKF
ncbi:MAG: hypothetical protein JWP47_1926 [Polaromonas sp.]|jgi:hypothetical protein|nr:hypothetical protein [Polaromonas sp.]